MQTPLEQALMAPTFPPPRLAQTPATDLAQSEAPDPAMEPRRRSRQLSRLQPQAARRHLAAQVVMGPVARHQAARHRRVQAAMRAVGQVAMGVRRRQVGRQLARTVGLGARQAHQEG